MAFSVFDDKAAKPGEDELARVLGKSLARWIELREWVGAECAPLSEEWTYSGKAYGWSLRLKQKKRAVLYLTPCSGFFRASLALGEKAAAAAHLAQLPESVLALIDDAPRYAEGRAIRIEVRKKADIQVVESIARIKMNT